MAIKEHTLRHTKPMQLVCEVGRIMFSYLDFCCYFEAKSPKGQNHIHLRLMHVLKEQHSMTFSQFQITFQPAGICISPMILGSRRANAHLLFWISQRFFKSSPQVIKLSC